MRLGKRHSKSKRKSGTRRGEAVKLDNSHPPTEDRRTKADKSKKKKGKWIEQRVNSGGKKKKVHRRRCIDLIWPMGNEKGRIEKNINNWELGIGKTRDKPQHQYKAKWQDTSAGSTQREMPKKPKKPKSPKTKSTKSKSTEQWAMSKAKQNKTKQTQIPGRERTKKKISIQGKGKKKLYKDLGF